MSALSREIPNAIDRVNAAWDRIEAMLPAEVLGDPATEAELDQLEQDLGLALPDYVRSSWLRHASTDGDSWDGGWIASPAQISNDYRMWTETEANGGFEDFLEEADDNADSDGKWYHEAWIPLTHDYGGNHICLDTRSGRLVDMDHESGSSFLDTSDWVAYLENTVHLLETKGRPSTY